MGVPSSLGRPRPESQARFAGSAREIDAPPLLSGDIGGVDRLARIYLWDRRGGRLAVPKRVPPAALAYRPRDGLRARPGRPNRYDQGCIFGPKPPIRSTLMRTISRFSPGWRNGYLSAFRNRLASLSM